MENMDSVLGRVALSSSDLKTLGVSPLDGTCHKATGAAHPAKADMGDVDTTVSECGYFGDDVLFNAMQQFQAYGSASVTPSSPRRGGDVRADDSSIGSAAPSSSRPSSFRIDSPASSSPAAGGAGPDRPAVTPGCAVDQQPRALPTDNLAELSLQQLERMLAEKKRLLDSSALDLPSAPVCGGIGRFAGAAGAMPTSVITDLYSSGMASEAWTVVSSGTSCAQASVDACYEARTLMPQLSNDSTAVALGTCSAASAGSPGQHPGLALASEHAANSSSPLPFDCCLPSAPLQPAASCGGPVDALFMFGACDSFLDVDEPTGQHQSALFASCGGSASPVNGTAHSPGAAGCMGRLSPEERAAKLQRYRSKRRARNFDKKIKYKCRKTLADTRPRIRGRFARDDELGAVYPGHFKKEQQQQCSGEEEEEQEQDVVVAA